MQVTRREFLRRLGSRPRLARLAGVLTQGVSEIVGPLRQKAPTAEEAGRALGERLLERRPLPAAVSHAATPFAGEEEPDSPSSPPPLSQDPPAVAAGDVGAPPPALPRPSSRQSARLLTALRTPATRD